MKHFLMLLVLLLTIPIQGQVISDPVFDDTPIEGVSDFTLSDFSVDLQSVNDSFETIQNNYLFSRVLETTFDNDFEIYTGDYLGDHVPLSNIVTNNSYNIIFDNSQNTINVQNTTIDQDNLYSSLPYQPNIGYNPISVDIFDAGFD